ncbi:23S rRNA pseudouridine synthase F [Pseudoalteromonas sp. MSK9-3]|uniref:pseudouridine synthase n=1 Tax=Pseudoalteromonas sp. MSK9-3 TaxID=1897633 RepID=UPI000E6D181D|nr:pseudouridine synthase [Pseudoalteromonas sp. MSK9-3]RJE77390.1 23S rRNA pseudouridine synthase F [Pseudoalteromonas sp. MSK9-3]
MPEPIRLAKFLGHAGVCSRRQASRLIDAGEVTVNGNLANHIDHVTAQDVVIVQGQAITTLPEKVLYAYHKPIGIDCKLNFDDPTSLIHYLPETPRVYPIGRLDKDSRGLLLLTNDGALCQQMLHPEHHQKKEYWVEVDRPIDTSFCQKMANGVPINGQITLPCDVELLTPTRFKITLQQGLNRQIRKMSHYCGYRVIDLFRVKIAGFTLQPSDLTEGAYQRISHSELGIGQK